jgi:hypothetical protein
MTRQNDLPDADPLSVHISKLINRLMDAQRCHDCGKLVPNGMGHYPNPAKYVRVCSACLPNHDIVNVASD